MFNWLFNKEKTVQANGPELTPLVKKLSDWVNSIKKSDMVTQRDDDSGYDVFNSEWTEDGYFKSAYCLWGPKNEETVKAIDIVRVENKGATVSDYTCIYHIREVRNGDDRLEVAALKEDNLKSCNEQAIEDMYYRLKILHRYSKQEHSANKAKMEAAEKYNSFVENF